MERAMGARALFLFDYLGFRKEAEPLVKMADEGNTQAVVNYAQEISHRLTLGGWILEGLGTTLKGFDQAGEANSNDWLRPGPWLTGQAFLVILSQYLQRLSPFSPFPTLAEVSKYLKWDESLVLLLQKGRATTTLLKPEDSTSPLDRPPIDERWNEPEYYWWWLRPSHAFETGWWNSDDIVRLCEALRESGFQIVDWEVEYLRETPNSQQVDLREYCREALTALEGAKSAAKGLFQILSQ